MRQLKLVKGKNGYYFLDLDAELTGIEQDAGMNIVIEEKNIELFMETKEFKFCKIVGLEDKDYYVDLVLKVGSHEFYAFLK